MYWKPTEQVDGGRFLAVAVRIFPDAKHVYQEFAGVGRTESEAKTKATLRMWREALALRGRENDHDDFCWPTAGQ